MVSQFDSENKSVQVGFYNNPFQKNDPVYQNAGAAFQPSGGLCRRACIDRFFTFISRQG
jgi:hypothetical protein